MDLQFNKNEDTNKLRLSEINQLYAKIKKGGGEKALQKQHVVVHPMNIGSGFALRQLKFELDVQ
jgi:hypothetical protein